MCGIFFGKNYVNFCISTDQTIQPLLITIYKKANAGQFIAAFDCAILYQTFKLD